MPQCPALPTHGPAASESDSESQATGILTPASGTLRYMISYMISEDNASDIDYDIIGFEITMIS